MSSYLNCVVCQKSAYDNEAIVYDKRRFHKYCFKCLNCKTTVDLRAVAMIQGDLYCKNCFVRMFQERGSYNVFKPGAERVKAPGSEEGEGEGSASAGQEKEVEKECTAFIAQAWKPTKCKTCLKEKTEHTEAAISAGAAMTPDAKSAERERRGSIGSSLGAKTPTGKKKPCKFGFRASPEKWKAHICSVCGLTEPEHSGDGSTAASPSTSVPSSPTTSAYALEQTFEASKPTEKAKAPEEKTPMFEIAPDPVMSPIASKAPTVSIPDPAGDFVASASSPLSPAVEAESTSSSSSYATASAGPATLADIFRKHGLGSALSSSLAADLRTWKADLLVD